MIVIESGVSVSSVVLMSSPIVAPTPHDAKGLRWPEQVSPSNGAFPLNRKPSADLCEAIRLVNAGQAATAEEIETLEIGKNQGAASTSI
jgi:hypothetical protein